MSDMYEDLGMKMCMECGEGYEMPEKHFDKDATKPDGLRTTCKTCRAEKDLKKEDNRIAKIVDDMDQHSVELLMGLAGSGSDVPHSAEIFQTLLRVFGGMDGFAQHYMLQYLSAKPGSQIRQRMLDTIIKLGMKVTDSGAAQLPVEMMGDEDIERELARRTKRLFTVVPEVANVKDSTADVGDEKEAG